MPIVGILCETKSRDRASVGLVGFVPLQIALGKAFYPKRIHDRHSMTTLIQELCDGIAIRSGRFETASINGKEVLYLPHNLL